MTISDTKLILDWINSEKSIAWIIKESQCNNVYRWKAVNEVNEIEPKEYCLWHTASGRLRIPSGSVDVEDEYVSNSFNGWEQTLKTNKEEVPWFGTAAPETFGFHFREKGKESENSLGRSGFTWIGNYFSVIGTSAPEESKKWWERLKKHIKKSATGIPWPGDIGSGKIGAYAFPEAYKQLSEGRSKDVNP